MYINPGIKAAKANADRIVACVNGCAGLNPAAYRQVVEALKEVARSGMMEHADKCGKDCIACGVNEALTAAQEAQ